MNNKYILNSSNVHKNYQIISLIGSGGMGSVYLVRSIHNPANIYALKYYNGAMNSTNAMRFRSETNLLKKVKSKYLPTFYEFYEDKMEMFYVMEYIEGETLSNLIDKKGRLESRRAINYMLQINEGIGELHTLNVIHRDIKSQNIILRNNQEIKIVDLGISIAPESQRLTKTNAIVCSPYYAAPEINHKISKQTDIYALGILFYKMLTGNYPFKGKDEYETIKMHKERDFPNIRDSIDVPWSIYNILAKATHKDYQKRYQTVWDFNKDLRECLKPEHKLDLPINIKTLQKMKPKSNFFASNKIWITFVFILIVILIFLVVFILYLKVY
ncbi:serine/threonine-protein kinase [Mycoplasmopsis cricetuli]|uniref:serine/threonine-protein kinase n=1 Tax=Mycoplasmopsis cricetuli TaxID=171283 RepID=UPI000472556A|nr:serine/threonine-protein kinase [Mycoplasmopsis cricetuli]